MNWRLYIHTDPNVLVGKPTIRGTRLSVEHVLALFASGWKMEQVLDSYPSLTSESIQAVFAYAAESIQDDRLFSLAS